MKGTKMKATKSGKNNAVSKYETVFTLLEKAVKTKKNPYAALVKLFGKPTDVFFKIQRRACRNTVVGGEMWFAGDDVCQYVFVSDRCIDVRGRESGGSGLQFADDSNGFSETESDNPIRQTIIAMFAELYRQK